MSEDRIPDVAFSRTIARENGKILLPALPSTRFELYKASQFDMEKARIELYGVRQFFKEYNIVERNFHPRPPAYTAHRREWLNCMYRLRINGVWYSPGGEQYEFFTKAEIAGLLLEN